MGNKKELGKGIRALLSSMEATDTSKTTSSTNDDASPVIAVNMIPLDHISPNPDQPRKNFNEEELEELAQSIKAMGIIQPLTLRRMAQDEYQIIAGERRYRASKLAGLTEVPAYVREADDTTLLEMALVENIQRKDLNAVEVAISFDRLIRECDITQEVLSERVGKKRSTVTNYLRLLKLPPEIQKAVKAELISMGHARALAGIDDPLLLMDIFKEVLQSGLSVRKTEALVAAYQNPAKEDKPKQATDKSNQMTPELRKIIEEMRENFGTKVNMERSAGGSGKITIPFKNDHELNFILDVLDVL